MDIQPQEVIQISLPGFRIENTTTPATCDIRRSLVESSSKISRGSWNLTSEQLHLTAYAKIEKKSSVDVTIPESFGLRLPLNGLELDHPTLEMGGYFQAGDVLMTTIFRSPQVSAIESFTLVMEPAMVAEDVELRFSFEHKARWRTFAPDETIAVFLPGFNSFSSDTIAIKVDHQQRFCIWEATIHARVIHCHNITIIYF